MIIKGLLRSLRSLAMTLTFAITLTPAHADINDGLVGHWSFDDGTATDSAGSNNGTLVGPTPVNGKVGSGALNFDGSNDYIEVAHHSSFNFDRTNPFTLSAWVKYDAGSGTYTIVSKEQAGGNSPGFEFAIDATNARLRLYVIGNNGSNLNFNTTSGSLSPGLWYHVVATVDGSGTGAGAQMYINGTPTGSGGGTLSASPLNYGALQIGHNPASGGSFFHGTMDDVRVYNRALTALEVVQLINDSGGAVPPKILTVSKVGTGFGMITGGSINCGSTCSQSVSLGDSITLVATPEATTAISWSGCTSTRGNSCTIMLSSNSTVTATFTYQGAPTIITAASCNNKIGQTDVQDALNGAHAGDTVSIPAGTCRWTTAISWNAPANVTLKGAGTSETGGGDKTVIIDDFDSKPNDNFNADRPLLQISGSESFRLTGITFQSGTGARKDNGTIAFYGMPNLRIDHCHLIASSGSNYQIISFGGGVFGVMDHCILDLTSTNALYFYNGRSGAGERVGNYEWTLPTNFGGPDYFFIEDNIINGKTSWNTYDTRIFDGYTGAKVVVRFNDAHEACLADTHATGHAWDDRGQRSQEIYGNKATSVLKYYPNYAPVNMRNGTTLLWGNSWDNVYKNIYLFGVTRKDNATYSQAPTPTSWGYAGTASGLPGAGSNWDGGTVLGTDTVRGYPVLDQPGRGQGDLLTGAFPNKVNTRTGTISWPNQALEPIYIWNNIGTIVSGWGGNVYSNDTGGRVQPNRDYYPPASGIQTSPTSPFNGTSGTGWGTLANRPTTCAAGVGYFATDQGNWNQSVSNPYGVEQNGADGVLYKCTSTNTWTLYYTPYTYPHPLTTSGGFTSDHPEGSGDVSGDGKVTMYDAALVLRFTLGSSLTDKQKTAADKNGDGKIDGADVVAIARRALGL